MEPTAAYEREGFFGQVVFTCGALIRDGSLHIYYGAADETMGLATVPLNELWASGLAPRLLQLP